jgi:hypothetical protein
MIYFIMSFQYVLSSSCGFGQYLTMSFLYQKKRIAPGTIGFLYELQDYLGKTFPLLSALIDGEIFVYHD